MADFLQETNAHLVRWLIHLKREPFNLAFNLVQPVILLVFMGGAFQRLAGESIGGDYRAYLLAGVLALTVFGNSMAGGIALLFDKESGFLLRLMSTPISRASILLGRFLAINVTTTLQCGIVLVLAFFFGIRVATGVGGTLALLVIGFFLGFGFALVSLLLAFVLQNHGDFFAILGLTTLPLTFLSSAFVPVDALAPWMKVLAWVNPMTYAIDAMRSLILSGWNGPVLLRMIVVLVVFNCLIYGIGHKVLKRQLG